MPGTACQALHVWMSGHLKHPALRAGDPSSAGLEGRSDLGLVLQQCRRLEVWALSILGWGSSWPLCDAARLLPRYLRTVPYVSEVRRLVGTASFKSLLAPPLAPPHRWGRDGRWDLGPGGMMICCLSLAKSGFCLSPFLLLPFAVRERRAPAPPSSRRYPQQALVAPLSPGIVRSVGKGSMRWHSLLGGSAQGPCCASSHSASSSVIWELDGKQGC